MNTAYFPIASASNVPVGNCLPRIKTFPPQGGFIRLGVKLAFLFAVGATPMQGEDRDVQWYPKSQGEMKAMLTVLAPQSNVSDRIKEDYIQRLKMYRYVCEVPFEQLSWDDEYAKLAFHASSICSKLNKLTHSPEQPAGMSDEDYALGKKGAGQSNLFMGRTAPIGCVDGWMDDSDDSNIDRVGHRRWCLNPKMLKSAFGTVGKYAAMYAFDNSNKSVLEWDYVAYPTRGYMPIDLFGGHYAWSVSINMGKYAKPGKDEVTASIQPVDQKLNNVGSVLELNYFNVETGGFGSGTAIIFRPKSFSLQADSRYKVKISGLKTKAGMPAPIEYLVHYVDIRKAPDTPEGKKIVGDFLRKQLDAIQATTDQVDRLDALIAFTEQDLVKTVDPTLAKEAKTTVIELLKDPILKKEMTATQKYQQVVELEKKAGDNKKTLVNVAATYREFAKIYKGTRAATKADADFERLKSELQ